MEPRKVIEIETISYFGKKRYYISPFLARRKKLEEKVPNYQDEQLKQKLSG